MKNNYPDLLKRIQEDNDPQAFRQFYDVFFDRLYAFSISFLKNRDDAQAVVSDVFVNMWRHRHKLLDIEDITAWLYTCTRNKTFDYLKHRFRELDLEVVYRQDDAFDWQLNSLSPEHELLVEELYERLEKALESLPPRQRMAFQLVRLEQMSYKEAAAILDISVSAVEKLMAKASAHLLTMLGDYVQKEQREQREKTMKIIRLAVFAPTLLALQKIF